MVTFSALYPVFFPCRPFSCCRYFWTWWSCETCVATTAKDAQFETYIALCIKIEELVWSVWMALDLDAVYRCFGTIRAFPTTWYLTRFVNLWWGPKRKDEWNLWVVAVCYTTWGIAAFWPIHKIWTSAPYWTFHRSKVLSLMPCREHHMSWSSRIAQSLWDLWGLWQPFAGIVWRCSPQDASGKLRFFWWEFATENVKTLVVTVPRWGKHLK